MPLISIRAYARLRGLKSDNSVRKAITSGKIPLVNGMIDPAIADAAWDRNRDTGQESKLAEAVSLAQKPVHAAEPIQQPLIDLAAAPPEQEPQPEAAIAPPTAARIWSTEESATIKQITRRKLEGGLIEAAEIDRDWCGLFQIAMDRLLQLPDDAAPVLIGCKTEAEMRSVLLKVIEEDIRPLIARDIRKMAVA